MIESISIRIIDLGDDMINLGTQIQLRTQQL